MSTQQATTQQPLLQAIDLKKHYPVKKGIFAPGKNPLLHRVVFFQVDSLQQRLLRGGLLRTHSVGLPASSSG